MTKTILRQGDVLLIRVDKMPKDSKKVPRGKDPRGLVLAVGEGANHAHSILAKNVVLYAHNEDRYVVVGGKGAVLRHALPGMQPTGDHGPIKLPSGVYEFRRQVEYRDEMIQRVED
jgi:hypothetical protein